ncbi:MAG: isochorismate synthase [Flavobacteriaceae bacterium]|nr:isochorismate synthase [Flavobacteriaceae bacterium]|tara:strand:- start:962 stop:2032 length:1071 start_codon:yes stop_codon:yes gene_type:complete
MPHQKLFQKAKEHFESKIPFVLFATPGEKTITAAFQKENINYSSTDFSEESFAMAPFHFDGNVLQIPFEHCDVQTAIAPAIDAQAQSNFDLEEDPADKEKHENLVSKAIDVIAKGSIHKVVVSRQKKVTLTKFDLEKLCKSLFSKYPDAFRYVWYHPETNIWCGATPEILLETKNRQFKTMALAGTQRIDEKMMIQWSAKEKQEQQWVTDAIIASLESKTTVLKVARTETHIAGNLAHLKTEISGALNKSRTTTEEIANALHPTPAVCGTPRTAALRFIKANEGYDRSFYTGFLGPVGSKENQTRLFVNLRCLSINDSIATLYAGGGITFDSDPESEWQETHDKLQTMAKVLEPLL